MSDFSEDTNVPTNDCISRQAAIEDIRTMIPKDARLDIKWIEMWLMQLPSVQPERWIPCSERLPEENGRYLVTRGLKACNSIWNRVYIVNYTDLMGLIAEKIWWEGNVGKSDFQEIDDVIAWMPLPEPYKGEQE